MTTKPRKVPAVRLPRREHSAGPKKMVAMRLPVALWAQVEKLSPAYGSNVTEVVTALLEEFVKHASKRERR